MHIIIIITINSSIVSILIITIIVVFRILQPNSTSIAVTKATSKLQYC